MERLTISGGELGFYSKVLNKCSNQNKPEIKAQLEAGKKSCDIEGYESICYSEDELKAIYARLAELEDRLESGQLLELPCVAMIEQGRVDGKFKQTREAQQFNGRYAVVYLDKSKYSKPLIDVCWSSRSHFDFEQAEARLKELQEER